MWIYTRVAGHVTATAEYKRLTAAGWTYQNRADRVRANYYNLLFRCGS